VVAVVPDASKNTDNGATPVRRLGTIESVMAPVAPVVEHADEVVTLTVVLWLAVPPGPVHVTV
jgi:hypothetical protein